MLLTQNVLPLKSQRNRLGLNWRWLRKFLFDQGLAQSRVEFEAFKTGIVGVVRFGFLWCVCRGDIIGIQLSFHDCEFNKVVDFNWVASYFCS